MDDLSELWPDPDRREAALYRVAGAVGDAEQRTVLYPPELSALQAASFGLDTNGIAHVLCKSPTTIGVQLKSARRALRAKNTTHACCEAIRQGLIR